MAGSDSYQALSRWFLLASFDPESRANRRPFTIEGASVRPLRKQLKAFPAGRITQSIVE